MIFSFIVVINPELTADHLLAILGGEFYPGELLITVLSGIFLYRAWAQIQDGQARTTPGKQSAIASSPFSTILGIRGGEGPCRRHPARYALPGESPLHPISRSLTISYCILMIVGGRGSNSRPPASLPLLCS